MELKVDKLSLSFYNARGHEHRVQPIALRAVDLLADRLDRGALSSQSNALAELDANAEVDFHSMTDEEAADRIAGAWFAAIKLKMND